MVADAVADCLDRHVSDWGKIKNIIKDSLSRFLMEAYEEKSYDLTDHYGSVRRRRRSMSSRTREINKITMAIIRISVKLMLLALLILLLYEAVIRGYAFGHAVFYAEAVEAAPGHDITVVVKDGEDVSQDS